MWQFAWVSRNGDEWLQVAETVRESAAQGKCSGSQMPTQPWPSLVTLWMGDRYLSGTANLPTVLLS